MHDKKKNVYVKLMEQQQMMYDIENQLAVSRTLKDYSIDKHITPVLSDLIQYSKQSSLVYVILTCN